MTIKSTLNEYGFAASIADCTLVYGAHMESLTITPPEGGKVGLSIGRRIAAAENMLAALRAIV